MKITVMCDIKDSFLHEYIPDLIEKIKKRGDDAKFIKDSKNIPKGDVLFLLGCSKILSKEELSLNKHNIVIHPSKLPEGRGSAALIWRILEGKNEGYITMFEAGEKIDSGNIYFQEKVEFGGYELSDEIRHKQAKKEMELVLRFIDNYPNVNSKSQKGKVSYYSKRNPKDSELDIDKTIREQFNLLRVVDNKKYPAFFYHKGHKYTIKIYRENYKREKLNNY